MTYWTAPFHWLAERRAKFSSLPVGVFPPKSVTESTRSGALGVKKKQAFSTCSWKPKFFVESWEGETSPCPLSLANFFDLIQLPRYAKGILKGVLFARRNCLQPILLKINIFALTLRSIIVLLHRQLVDKILQVWFVSFSHSYRNNKLEVQWKKRWRCYGNRFDASLTFPSKRYCCENQPSAHAYKKISFLVLLKLISKTNGRLEWNSPLQRKWEAITAVEPQEITKEELMFF